MVNDWNFEELTTGTIKLKGYINEDKTSVVVPEKINGKTVVAIGPGCFRTDMEYLSISKSVEDINTWGDWIELKEIYVDPENAHYMSRHGVLYSKDGTKLIRVPSKIDSIPSDILSGVTHIEEYAFDEVVCITEIDIPESVVSIGDAAFAWCENLVKVSIADSVKSIGEGVFCGCHISQIKLPISITALEEYEYDEGLGFFMCCQFESFTVPNSVVSIGRRCFKSCNQLREVYIPASVQVIDELVFEGCSQLEAIRVAPNNPYFYDIDGVLYSREGTLIRVPQQYSVNSFNIKDGIGKIRGYAFSDCKKIEYINCPDSVMEIGNGAFLKSGLKTFTIPGKVTTINYNVFSCCLDLRELQIHKYVDTIDRTLFDELNYILSKTIVTVEKENSDFESRNGKLRRLRQ